jgi:hypothetical protein
VMAGRPAITPPIIPGLAPLPGHGGVRISADSAGRISGPDRWAGGSLYRRPEMVDNQIAVPFGSDRPAASS